MNFAEVVQVSYPFNDPSFRYAIAGLTTPVVTVPSIPALPAGSEIALGPSSILGTVASVAALIFFLRKKYFQDGTDITRSRAESTLITTLIEQAAAYKKDAQEAWDQRTKDAEMIARQSEEIKNLKATLNMIKEMLREIAPDKASMFDTVETPKPTQSRRAAKKD